MQRFVLVSKKMKLKFLWVLVILVLMKLGCAARVVYLKLPENERRASILRSPKLAQCDDDHIRDAKGICRRSI